MESGDAKPRANLLFRTNVDLFDGGNSTYMTLDFDIRVQIGAKKFSFYTQPVRINHDEFLHYDFADLLRCGLVFIPNGHYSAYFLAGMSNITLDPSHPALNGAYSAGLATVWAKGVDAEATYRREEFKIVIYLHYRRGISTDGATDPTGFTINDRLTIQNCEYGVCGEFAMAPGVGLAVGLENTQLTTEQTRNILFALNPSANQKVYENVIRDNAFKATVGVKVLLQSRKHKSDADQE